MKELIKCFIVLILGICVGYFISSKDITNIFKTKYKAFQVGVYTSLDAANTCGVKYDNSIIIKDNELYRVYVAILRNEDNINLMSNYLNNKGIDYYLKDLDIDDKNLKRQINEFENIMNTDNELVFLQVNKMIMERYKESL